MTPAGWSAVPLSVHTDADHGGRWTSLSAAGREWLWRNPDAAVVAARARVRPGMPFVDAGGVEECLPTINGLPDHGAIWSVPWDSHGTEDVVVAGDLSLTRTITVDDGTVSARYRISGPPGAPFVHAVHALLDLGPHAALRLPGPQAAVVVDDAGSAGEPVSWPPIIAGIPADRLGPADGTAVDILLPGCHGVVVMDGADALQLRWAAVDAAADDPCSLLVWRNLGGWPAASPYRSIGIEPMVGRSTTLRSEGPHRLPPTGTFGWQLQLCAWRISHVS